MTRIVFAMLAAATFLPSASIRAACTEPGKARWSIKSSLAANVSSKKPKTIALSDLTALVDAKGVKHNDARYASTRIPDAANAAGLKEGDLVTTEGWLHLVAREDNDCEYHIQISGSPTDGDQCLIVEVAKDDATSIGDPALRAKATAVREFIRTKLLKGHEPSGGGSVMQHPVYVRVTGQLFFDDAHVKDQPRGKKGMKAATLWELHPVTSIAFAVKPT